MRAALHHNTGELRRKMLTRAALVASELRLENVAIARELTEFGRVELQHDVYDIPEKTSSTGRKLWVRTGALKAAERWVARGMSVVHRNAAPHYVHRYRYGKPGGQKASPPQKASFWVRNTVTRNGSAIRSRRRAAIRRAWKRAL